MEEKTNTIKWEDFTKIEIRVGTVLKAEILKAAKQAAFKLEIDFGEFGIKKSSAQITKLYKLQELVGKQIIAVVNFPPKQIANMMSECLVLGVIGKNNEVSLLTADKQVINGLRIG